MITKIEPTATSAWAGALHDLVYFSCWTVAPRGKLTYEIPHSAIEVNMRYPVVLAPVRKLSYKFMAAEAYWILSGDDTVLGIAPWNNKIADFSDDGVRFFGAYGPKIVDQLPYVLAKLKADPETRQAGMTIWRENPPQTKDVPCTVAIFAQIREGKLNLHVFMRSSDVWLGLPYDIFNFSMLAHVICGRLRTGPGAMCLEPGTLYLTAASMHLYDINHADASTLLVADTDLSSLAPPTPESLYQNPEVLKETLEMIRDSDALSPSRWWNHAS